MDKLQHIPVLCAEAVDALAVEPDGIYVDATFGGGGHARAIMDRLTGGRLYAFDQDSTVAERAARLPELRFVSENFRHLCRALAERGVNQVRGVLADLGMSTLQLQHPQRGFSYGHLEAGQGMKMDQGVQRTAAGLLKTDSLEAGRGMKMDQGVQRTAAGLLKTDSLEAGLDMRMDQGVQRTAAGLLKTDSLEAGLDMRMDQGVQRTAAGLLKTDSLEAGLDMRMDQRVQCTAAGLLKTASQPELRRVFAEYGELPRAAAMARSIVEARDRVPLQTVGQLRALLQRFVPPRQPARFWARLFQALRIAVNDELEALKAFLQQAAKLISAQGRLVVISYHSLEDRLVKRFLRHGHFDRTPLRDSYGRPLPVPFVPLHVRPICPSLAESTKNPSARSAKLRVGVKNDYNPDNHA